MLKGWQRYTTGPMLAVGLIYAFLYVTAIFLNPSHTQMILLCNDIQNVIWGVFVADLIVRFCLYPSPINFFKEEIFLIFITFIPLLRPLRVLRVLYLLFRYSRRLKQSQFVALPLVAAIGAVLMTFVVGAAVLDAERYAPGATIKTPGDAVWWGLVTMTTIGYGDRYPITTEGRLLASGLIIVGIGFVSVFTASLAAWMLTTIGRETSEEVPEAVE